MKHITMTEAQTMICESGNESLAMPILAALREQAQTIADKSGHTVEIYTYDGDLVDAREPNHDQA